MSARIQNIMPGKTAAVIGSTGLIGGHLVELLARDRAFETVRLLVRRPVQPVHPKIEMKLVNFDEHESVKLAIDGCDAVFCAVGTTQKKVKGNKEAYRKVDYDIPVNAARFAAETRCQSFHLVSSVGANSKSNNFYLGLKGEVEERVQSFAIPVISIFRPSILLGNRDEKRPGEKIGQVAASFFAFLMMGGWEKYRPIEASYVAKAMIKTAKELKRGTSIYEYKAIRSLVLSGS
jgi:uncharacterized protein YbjT (DUF2867 family)